MSRIGIPPVKEDLFLVPKVVFDVRFPCIYNIIQYYFINPKKKKGNQIATEDEMLDGSKVRKIIRIN